MNAGVSGSTRHGAWNDAESGEEHARQRLGMSRRYPQMHGRMDQGFVRQSQPTVQFGTRESLQDW